MTTEPRFVFDTNVLISAALNPHGTPRAALVAAGEAGILLASVETLAELESRLHRPKFDHYLDTADRAVFLKEVRCTVRLVRIAERTTACRDPKDDKFLDVAVAGEADALITGDADLLVLHPFRGIPILRPADFLVRP